MEIEIWRAPKGSSRGSQDNIRGHGRDWIKVFSDIWAKMGARSPKLGPSWQEAAAKTGYDGARMAILRSA